MNWACDLMEKAGYGIDIEIGASRKGLSASMVATRRQCALHCFLTLPSNRTLRGPICFRG